MSWNTGGLPLFQVDTTLLLNSFNQSLGIRKVVDTTLPGIINRRHTLNLHLSVYSMIAVVIAQILLPDLAATKQLYE